MNISRIILCDEEEEYAVLMSDYLRDQNCLPCEVKTFTNANEMLNSNFLDENSLLLVSEKVYMELDADKLESTVIVLNESGVIEDESVKHVDKYKSAEEVLEEVYEVYLSSIDEVKPKLKGNKETKLIGLFSPVRSSLQTSFAITLSQILSKNHKTLYVNFEYFAGLPELIESSFKRDLSDLLFFLNTESEKFEMRLQSVIRKYESFEFIPPVKYGENLLHISPREWVSLINKIIESKMYDFLVLDLSESMQGLFDVLRKCDLIYTVTNNDYVSKCKIDQYEQLLQMCDYEDVMKKTDKWQTKRFIKLPEDIMMYSKSEIAESVREALQKSPYLKE